MNNTNSNYIDPAREIHVPPQYIGQPSGMLCWCGGNLFYGTIPCPDGRSGCCVAHYGYICNKCGKIYQ